MRTLLRRLFLENWKRKLFALLLAIVVWLIVNHSLTASKTVDNVPVRVVNIPKSKTLEGLQGNGLMTRKIPISLVGKKSVLDELGPNDFEIVVDAENQSDEFIVSIAKKNLVSLNPQINLQTSINKVHHQNFIIRMAEKKTAKIPVYIKTCGEPPKGYQFLDVYPYRLSLTVTGPEKDVEEQKEQGLWLTLNNSIIKKRELDQIDPNPDAPRGDVVSYFVPEQWKQLSIPKLAERIEIDDPLQKSLRIDFVRSTIHPIKKGIPVSFYLPEKLRSKTQLTGLEIEESHLFSEVNGVYQTSRPLYAKGVSQLFLDIVEDMMQIVVTPDSNLRNGKYSWSVQFINPVKLEETYVKTMMNDKTHEDLRDLNPEQQEDYLRNRFRNFMHRFRLYTESDQKLILNITQDSDKIKLAENSTLMDI